MGIRTCSMVSRSRTVTQWSAGGGFIAHSLEVYGDAQGRADLVLAAVPLADGAGVIKVHHKVLLQLVIDLFGLAGELLDRGSTAAL